MKFLFVLIVLLNTSSARADLSPEQIAVLHEKLPIKKTFPTAKPIPSPPPKTELLPVPTPSPTPTVTP